jgi:hypothetical protein
MMGPQTSRDRTEAMALQIAHQRLEKLGWNYATSDIGKLAREILDALDAPRADKAS